MNPVVGILGIFLGVFLGNAIADRLKDESPKPIQPPPSCIVREDDWRI